PVDHGDRVGSAPAAEHDVLSEKLPVDHIPRKRAEPIDPAGIAVKPAADGPALPGVQIRENPPDGVGAAPVMPAVELREKARLRVRQTARRSVKAGDPSGGGNP